MLEKQTFGKHLKMLREKAKMTQQQLADNLQISRQSISKWEQDIALPNILFCIPLIECFRCTLDELFQYQRIENKNSKSENR